MILNGVEFFRKDGEYPSAFDERLIGAIYRHDGNKVIAAIDGKPIAEWEFSLNGEVKARWIIR